MTTQQKQQQKRVQERALKRKRERPLPSPRAFAYTLEDAQMMGLPGRTTIWKMRKAGTLEEVVVGGRILLTGDSVRRVLGVKEEVAA
jgi:hypothetical protein